MTTIAYWLGRIRCLLGFHNSEGIEKDRGIVGGFRCLRESCNWRIEPIRWPEPTEEPKHTHNLTP